MRKSFNKRALLATTLLTSLSLAGAANAQVATDPSTGPAEDPNVQASATDQTPATQENPADTPAVDAVDADSSNNEGEIVVTGSRIASPNIVSLAPVQVVGETEIDQAGAINLQEVLLENPVFGEPALSTTNSAFLTSGAGTATVDLRNLGTNRTLVLINSRRVVGGIAGSPTVDLNVIPTQFLERVDILTGGASSLYGSDAVAGVVNMIYKRNFEGLLLEGQYGITQRGDYPRYQVSATAGGNFMDGRGNLMVHLGYSQDEGLLSRKRRNTRVDDIAYLLFYYDPEDFNRAYEPFFSSFPPQGRFFTGDLVPGASGNQQYTFTYGPDGTLQPCNTTNGGACNSLVKEGANQDLNGNGIKGEVLLPSIGTGTGPNGFNRQYFRTLSTPVERWLFAQRGHFDVTDNISFITEATYAKTSAKSEIEPFPFDSGTITPSGLFTIQSIYEGNVVDNAYVPQDILDVAIDQDGDGLKDLGVARRLSEVGTRNLTADRDFLRLVTGFEGKVFNDRFSWDVTYNFGRTEESQRSNGQVNVPNLLNAFAGVVDTADVDNDGDVTEVICASAQARLNGCVPINLFGTNSISPEALNYVAAETNHSFKITQQVLAANLSGALFELPAGPLGIAVGAEYRKEQSEENWDALTNAGLNAGNALPDTAGQFNVKEAYGEINVPILAGQPFAHQLNLRAAGRVSDYSTVGGVTTWSLGGDYAPIEAVRFRATLAKAVRAPNIGELFTGPSQTFPPGLIDPCLNVGPTGDPAGAPAGTGDRCRADPGVLANITQNGVFTLTQPDKQGVSGFTSGNPNLGAETGKSFTAGVVINPRGIDALRNLVLSVDYWRIKVTDAVTFPPRQTVLNLCYQQGVAEYCDFIIRNPTQLGSASAGSIAFINIAPVNAAVRKDAGIDTVLQYRSGLDFLMGGLNMNARIAWTHLLEGYNIPLPGSNKNRIAGEVGAAKDRVNGTIGFNTDRVGLSFTGTYIGKSYIDDNFQQAIGLDDDETLFVDEQFYLDAQLRFTPSRTYEFFLGADNLLDNKAPNIFSGITGNVTGADTNAGVYDVFGRRFYAGARLRF